MSPRARESNQAREPTLKSLLRNQIALASHTTLLVCGVHVESYLLSRPAPRGVPSLRLFDAGTQGAATACTCALPHPTNLSLTDARADVPEQRAYVPAPHHWCVFYPAFSVDCIYRLLVLPRFNPKCFVLPTCLARLTSDICCSCVL